MPWYVYVLGALGLGVGGFFAARSSKFWISMAKDLFKELWPSFLKLFDNRPKTPEEWAEWRRLSSMNDSDMSPTDKERFKELKRLNKEYRNK